VRKCEKGENGTLHRLVLPWPPSANRYWRHVGPRVLISREGRIYRRNVANCVAGQGLQDVQLAGRLGLVLEVRAPITPATLSETSLGHFLNRFLTETETGAAAVVHAYPAPDRLLSDLPPGLQAVMDANPDARLAGPIAVTNELKVIVKRDAFIALTIGTIIVFLMLALELGGWRHGLLALIPLIAGVIWMLGTMSMLGLPTNYMNIFVFTMIVGIGVDYGIHLIHRLNETNRVEALAATSRTIVVAALTTVLGFGSLITSHYPGLRSMGITAILGAVYTALAAIVLLPALASIPESQKKR